MRKIKCRLHYNHNYTLQNPDSFRSVKGFNSHFLKQGVPQNIMEMPGLGVFCDKQFKNFTFLGHPWK